MTFSIVASSTIKITEKSMGGSSVSGSFSDTSSICGNDSDRTERIAKPENLLSLRIRACCCTVAGLSTGKDADFFYARILLISIRHNP